jgi:hypothetical protein
MKISRSAGEFQDPLAGTYPAVCVQVIDLGTQKGEYNGKPTSKHQVLIQFELHGDSLTSDASGYMQDGNGQPDPTKPFLVGAWLTVSFHEEATLRKFMESWRGNVPYTEEQLAEFETEGFDWSKMLGHPCMVQMAPNANGKMKVSAITKFQKNLLPPSPVNRTFAYVIGDAAPAVWALIPEGIQKKIVASPEYREASGETRSVVGAAPADPAAPFDDEIPF